MKRGRYICAATKNGSVHLLDSVSFAVVKSWNAHSALINDMDAQHDFIVTCGYSLRQGQNYMLDPFLNVFDIRKMSSMPPIPFPAGAAYVRMHPRMLTTSIVVSQTGQMHVVDLMNPNTSNVRQANVLTYLSMFEIAPSGEAIALTDPECSIHLWGSPPKLHFVDIAAPIEFATPEDPLPSIEWNADTWVTRENRRRGRRADGGELSLTLGSPLSSIGLPYYREVLASAWPDMVVDVGAPPARLDPQFVNSLKAADFGLYGRNTRGLRRNQAEDTRNVNKSANTGLKAPKFLSEKARESAKSDARAADDKTEDLSSPLGGTEIGSKKSEVPVAYRNVEIKYSKFGVDDFDFGCVCPLLWLPPDNADKRQLLQQDALLWLGDSHFQFLRKLPLANHELYAPDSELGAAARRYCMRQRNLPALRARLLVRHASKGRRFDLSSDESAEDAE